ncbi:maleylpyruvate isomerase family mycothiol-dependent enzyme [Sphaerisporangium melleum]|uniref:maleylpyruvate isomerase family mycothiol-dependent enzyme n=1 Tax=Sphaerisporangium melleum TaxID=321316 RepID=UPI00166D20A7|nr:maleylpyruvate isomerase family mycothiol-dependent enzyme [Sphaerisporangium melleum]
MPHHSAPLGDTPGPDRASTLGAPGPDRASTPGEPAAGRPPVSSDPGRVSTGEAGEPGGGAVPGVPGTADPVTRLRLDVLAEAASEAPPGARERLLAAARAARPPAVAVAGIAAPYAARVAAMDALLACAGEADWSRTIVEGWTLQQLLAHLAATDGLVAAAIGAPVAGPATAADADVAERTAAMIAHVAGQPPELTRADWRAQAGAICRRAASLDPATLIAPGGMAFPLPDHLLARMLETWIHTADAAAAMGRSLPLPVAGHITPTADFCARLLPWTSALSGVEAADRAIRLTLTGPGGGAWHVPLDLGRAVVPDDGSPVDATITCDAVGFCFLLGGRGAPATFPAEVTGDAGLARDVLHAAPALSGP